MPRVSLTLLLRQSCHRSPVLSPRGGGATQTPFDRRVLSSPLAWQPWPSPPPPVTAWCPPTQKTSGPKRERNGQCPKCGFCCCSCCLWCPSITGTDAKSCSHRLHVHNLTTKMLAPSEQQPGIVRDVCTRWRWEAINNDKSHSATPCTLFAMLSFYFAAPFTADCSLFESLPGFSYSLSHTHAHARTNTQYGRGEWEWSEDVGGNKTEGPPPWPPLPRWITEDSTNKHNFSSSVQGVLDGLVWRLAEVKNVDSAPSAERSEVEIYWASAENQVWAHERHQQESAFRIVCYTVERAYMSQDPDLPST